MKRYGLRDDQWECIESLLAGREGHVGANGKDNRLFLLRLYCISTVRAFHGGTSRRALVIFALFTRGTCAGVRAVFGNVFSST